MTIGVVFEVVGLCPDLFARGASTPPFISQGCKVTRKVTKSVTI
jgi:hypothetical protein